jgi:hypothetical protein
MSASQATAPGPSIRALSDELDRLAPRFDVDASQIKILRTPTEFYETLKVWARLLRYVSGLMLMDRAHSQRYSMPNVVYTCRPCT